LGLTQISQPDVVRKILSVLPIEKYGHIVTMLHQMDLSITMLQLANPGTTIVGTC
jgi:hypothetical protein